MRELRNRVVQVRRFGGPDELEVVDAPLPKAGFVTWFHAGLNPRGFGLPGDPL